MKTGSAIIKVPEKVNKGELFKIIFVIIHPMETGTRKDSATGQTIPAHHLTAIDVIFAGKTISSIEVGPGVSKNPTFSIMMKIQNSGELKLSYSDNKSGSWSKSKQINI